MNQEEVTSENTDYIDKFSKSVIMGDSRSEGFIAYGILTNSSVVAYKGRTVETALSEGDLKKVANLSPQNVFVTYGVNDVVVHTNPDGFITQYEKLIKELQRQLPDSKIYVNSIFKTSNVAIQKKSEFKRIDVFNRALQQMCNKLDITYIDGSSCVEDNLYAGDGIHFKSDFNKKWLNLLIDEANL